MFSKCYLSVWYWNWRINWISGDINNLSEVKCIALRSPTQFDFLERTYHPGRRFHFLFSFLFTLVGYIISLCLFLTEYITDIGHDWCKKYGLTKALRCNLSYSPSCEAVWLTKAFNINFFSQKFSLMKCNFPWQLLLGFQHNSM